eukprot:TRINITY_DN4880_c0_g1_i1.p1 TRINITY_DN4880_c0_g1~~TRINITY_DN4880_c0_g1_i1.p1  ORF type:complete len:403 (-),score=93.23 TRINITY_DN4880_c0_g1_i1:266-1474(-)
MAEEPSSSRAKRPLSDVEDEPNQPPLQKRPRFPKGKKVKKGDEIAAEITVEKRPSDLADPRLASKERAKRRNQFTAELFSDQTSGILQDINAAEVNYEDNLNLEDDGIQMEPFNLNQEREEGYFDADGNFVEYVYQNEAKDAWLDSLDSVKVDSRFAKKDSEKTIEEEEDFHDLSSEDMGKIKRRIANLLQPGETVLQALRRLKGTSNDRKGRMTEETKLMFNQLTEDSMKLMDNGEYNVYHDKQEIFEREAEGYEHLARLKAGTSGSSENGNLVEGISNGVGPGIGNSGDAFDMFGEDDENPTSDPLSNGDGLGCGSTPEPSSESLVPAQNVDSEKAAGGETETDYVYDESSGYYYSSSLGYYYDPTSGMYCCATSGRWYSFNEQTGGYDEIHGEAPFTAN